jgi:hypothetical protein
MCRVLTRRRLHLVIALLLPLMALRSLLPAGYMTVAEHGTLRIVMCSAGLALSADAGKSSTDHQLPGDSGTCSFAHAAVSAPPVQHVVTLLDPPRELLFVSRSVDTLPPATGPPRMAAARAPPALS